MQVGQASTVLAGITSAQRTGSGNLGRGTGGSRGILERGEKALHGLGGQVLVVVIVDLDHGGVDASAEALDLNVGEKTVLGGVARGNAEVLVDCLHDGVTAAATELAGSLKEKTQISNRPGKFGR